MVSVARSQNLQKVKKLTKKKYTVTSPINVKKQRKQKQQKHRKKVNGAAAKRLGEIKEKLEIKEKFEDSIKLQAQMVKKEENQKIVQKKRRRKKRNADTAMKITDTLKNNVGTTKKSLGTAKKNAHMAKKNVDSNKMSAGTGTKKVGIAKKNADVAKKNAGAAKKSRDMAEKNADEKTVNATFQIQDVCMANDTEAINNGLASTEGKGTSRKSKKRKRKSKPKDGGKNKAASVTLTNARFLKAYIPIKFEENDFMTEYEGFWVQKTKLAFLDKLKNRYIRQILNGRKEEEKNSNELTAAEKEFLEKRMKKLKKKWQRNLKRLMIWVGRRQLTKKSVEESVN